MAQRRPLGAALRNSLSRAAQTLGVHWASPVPVHPTGAPESGFAGRDKVWAHPDQGRVARAAITRVNRKSAGGRTEASLRPGTRFEASGSGYKVSVLVDILIAILIVVVAAVLGLVVHPLLWIIVIAAILWLFTRRGRW